MTAVRICVCDGGWVTFRIRCSGKLHYTHETTDQVKGAMWFLIKDTGRLHNL